MEDIDAIILFKCKARLKKYFLCVCDCLGYDSFMGPLVF